MSAPADWENHLCDGVCGGNCENCMGAWFCAPCLYGRASQRLSIFPINDENRLHTCDPDCWLWTLSAVTCAVQCIPMMFKRQQLRKTFNIEGNLCADCAITYFCTPCAIAQMNTEMKKRAEMAQTNPQQQQQGYQPQTQGMVYQPPQEKHNSQLSTQPAITEHPAFQPPVPQTPAPRPQHM